MAEVLSWLFYTAIAIVVAWLLSRGFGYRIHMSGQAMLPEIEDGQGMFLDRVNYVLSSPKRGDIVAFYPNGNENAHLMVRRVVGLPGETVKIQDGLIYINDRIYMDREHHFDRIMDPGIAANGLTLTGKEYFVLGDLRNASEDSRSAEIGTVSLSSMAGRVWFVYGKRKKQ